MLSKKQKRSKIGHENQVKKALEVLQWEKINCRKLFKLSESAPDFAKRFQWETRIAFKGLSQQFINRNVPCRPGAKGVNDVAVTVTDEVVRDILENLDFATPRTRGSRQKGVEVQEIVWNIFDRDDALSLLNMFEDTFVCLESVWIRDRVNGALPPLRIVNPRENAPFLFDCKRYREYAEMLDAKRINEPLEHHVRVLIGRVHGKKRACPLQLVYSRNLAPALPGGTLRLHYYYQKSTNGFLQEEVVQEDLIEEEDLEAASMGTQVVLTDEEAPTKVQFSLEEFFATYAVVN